MKLKRKISYLISICILTLLLPTQLASAQEYKTNGQQNVFGMEAVDKLTFQGNGGTCRLDYMSGSNSVSWGVKLNVGLVSFSGRISVSGQSPSNSMYSKTYTISGASGVVNLDYSMPKGNYIVSISGTAIGVDGKKYTTVPNARLPFSKY